MFNDNLYRYGIKGNNGCAWDTLYDSSHNQRYTFISAQSYIKSSVVNDCFHRYKSFTARTEIRRFERSSRDQWAVSKGRMGKAGPRWEVAESENESSQKLVSVTYVANAREGGS